MLAQVAAGQAALFFSTHARSVTILCRGDRLEKSMSQYLIATIAAARRRKGQVSRLEGQLAERDAATRAGTAESNTEHREEPPHA